MAKKQINYGVETEAHKTFKIWAVERDLKIGELLESIAKIKDQVDPLLGGK